MTTILEYHNFEDLESKEAPLWFHELGLMETATGYGRKLTTTKMVKLPGNPRWRRVYCCCFSNSGTCYVTKGKDWVVIR